MKKLFMSLTALVFLIGGIIGVGIAASASDSLAPSAEIEYINLAYNNGQTHLALTVTGEELTEGRSYGIAVWYDAAVESPSLANADYINYTVRTDSSGREYFRTHPIAEQDHAKPILIAPVIDMGNFSIIAKTPAPFTVFDYAIARLDDAGVTAEQLTSYQSLLLNESIVQSSYGIAKAIGGYIGTSQMSFAAGKIGDSLLLRAEAKNAEGKYFLYWQIGEKQDTSRITKAAVKAGINEFCAVYGDKADSAYKYTYDFEAHDTGVIDIGTPTGISVENSSYKGRFYWRISGSSLGISFANGYSSKDISLPFKESSVLASDYHEITENEKEDKALVIDKGQNAFGYTDKISSPAEDGTVCTAVEADVILHSWSTTNPIRLSFAYTKTATDGKVSSPKTVSINPTISGDGFYICLDGKRDDRTPVYPYTKGTDNVFTVKYELVTVEQTVEEETKTYLGVNVYLDGELATESPFVTSTEAEEGAVYSITSFHIFQFVNQVGKCTVDNVTFFEQEKTE